MSQADDRDEFKLLFELCPDLFCIVDQSGHFTTLNDSWTSLLGYSKEELRASPIISFIHPDDRTATTNEISALASEKYSTIFFENRYRKVDGSYVWLAWSARSSDGKIFAYAKDITKIKRSEAFLGTIQSQAKIGGWTLSTADFKTTWTDETYHIHEVPVGTLTDTESGINFYHPDDQDKIRQYVKDCIEKKLPYDDMFRFITAKGRHIWVRATGQPMVDDAGRVTQLIGTFQDVDSLKLMTDELASATSQLEDVLTNSPGMVYQFQLDPDGRMFFPYASAQAFQIYEITAEEFKSDPSLMLTMAHSEDQGELREKIVASAQTMQPFEWTGRIQTPSKRTKWIKAKSIPRKLQSGSILWNGLVVDVTKEVELEKSLSEQRKIAEHAARLASIGELAAGVGHEINNPLTIVIGNLGKLSKVIEAAGPTRPQVQGILKSQTDACERIRKIVGGLRRLAHAGKTDSKESSDLTESVLATIELISEIYSRDGVMIRADVMPMDLAVDCSALHVQQILMNLVSNAKDAAIQAPRPQIQISVAEHSSHYTLCVSDNGPGITLADQSKIFSAFFSTKDVGKGTGLGLALSKSIIEADGGKIYFQSTAEGTQFFVEFPKARSTGISKEIYQTEIVPGEPIRTLVVDDEEGIREILADFLREYNCEVTAVDRAEAAIQVLRTSAFDLIISDIKMPGLDGIALLNALAEEGLGRESTKVLMTGGLIEDAAPPTGKSRLAGVDGVLNKPFVEAELMSIINLAQTRKRVA